MRAPGRLMVSALLLLVSAPVLALASDRDDRRYNREGAYRAGFDDGFRNGYRDGIYDSRTRAGYSYRGRDRARADGRLFWGFGHSGDYKKGFKDGYHRGYREGYDARGSRYDRYPRREFYYFRR